MDVDRQLDQRDLRGFVQFHRAILGIDLSDELLSLYVRLLASVNYLDNQFQGRLIRAGSMAFSYRELGPRLWPTGRPPAIGTLRKRINALVDLGLIEVDSGSEGSVLTIRNVSSESVPSVSTATDTLKDRSVSIATDTLNHSSVSKSDASVSILGLPACQQLLTQNRESELRKRIKKRKEEGENSIDRGSGGRYPSIEEVTEFAVSIGYEAKAGKFFKYYDGLGWKRKNGVELPDWREEMQSWMKSDGESVRQPPKRYSRMNTGSTEWGKL